MTEADRATNGALMRLPCAVDGFATSRFWVDVRAAAHPTVFALGVRKSGSSLFANLVNAMAGAMERTVVDIPSTFFAQNIPFHHWSRAKNLRKVVWPGNVYIGFRDAPVALYDDPVFNKARKILLVRDPRDLLVSEYFSNAYSHSLPDKDPSLSVIARQRKVAQDTDVASYVLARAQAINETIRGYHPLIKRGDVTVMRYEDVIFDKAAWIRDIARIFEFDVSEALIAQLLSWADVVPTKENPTNFVRRVAPGDHLNKLSPDVIAKLERSLDNLWWDLGYTQHR